MRRNTSYSGGGSLRDISPTLLGMLGLEKPGRMTGGDLRTPKLQ